MKKINKHIQIVRSTDTLISSMGNDSCESVIRILKKNYKKVELIFINNSDDLMQLLLNKADLVYLAVKQVPVLNSKIKKTIWVSSFLEDNNIPYTGSPASAIALDFDKTKAKKIMFDNNISSADYFVTKPGQYKTANQIPIDFPMFIKPISAGDKRGIDSGSVILNFNGYTKKVKEISDNIYSESLVETYLSGREFTVAVLGQLDNEQEPLIMPVEVIVNANERGDRILGATGDKSTEQQVILVTDVRDRKNIIELTRKVFSALGARGYGRIDIRMDEKGVPHFLEANLIPSMGVGNYFHTAFTLSKNLDYESIILRIVDLALSRNEPEIQRSVVGKLDLAIA